MCGRYSVFSSTEVLQDRFAAEAAEQLTPHFNAAPSERLPVITSDTPRAIRLGEWGLRPPWFRGSAGVINARAETVAEKPMFRSALRKRRCLVLADSFFEWDRTHSPRLPWRILLKSEKPFAFAGIWEPSPATKGLPTFAIVTTRPNPLVGRIHDRMPVILPRATEEASLQGGSADFLRTLLQPYRADDMTMYPVSLRVNSARVDDADLITPKFSTVDPNRGS